MSDVFAYILILASVILFGFSLSRFFDSFDSVKKRVKSSHSLFESIEEPTEDIRRVNTVQNVLLAAAYVSGAYFARFSPWVLALMVGKFSLSCAVSDKFFRVMLSGNPSLSRPFYWALKFDALSNVLVSLFILLAISL